MIQSSPDAVENKECETGIEPAAFGVIGVFNRQFIGPHGNNR